jgi:hypothetical protein
MTTAEWAVLHGLPADRLPLDDEPYDKPYARSAREKASRCLVLVGVIAVAAGADPQVFLNWYRAQGDGHGSGARATTVVRASCGWTLVRGRFRRRWAKILH